MSDPTFPAGYYPDTDTLLRSNVGPGNYATALTSGQGRKGPDYRPEQENPGMVDRAKYFYDLMRWAQEQRGISPVADPQAAQRARFLELFATMPAKGGNNSTMR